MHFEVRRNLVVEGAHELLEFDRAVTRVQRPDHLAGSEIERRVQTGGARALVIVGRALGGARQHRQTRGGPIERLEVRTSCSILPRPTSAASRRRGPISESRRGSGARRALPPPARLSVGSRLRLCRGSRSRTDTSAGIGADGMMDADPARTWRATSRAQSVTAPRSSPCKSCAAQRQRQRQRYVQRQLILTDVGKDNLFLGLALEERGL